MGFSITLYLQVPWEFMPLNSSIYQFLSKSQLWGLIISPRTVLRWTRVQHLGASSAARRPHATSALLPAHESAARARPLAPAEPLPPSTGGSGDGAAPRVPQHSHRLGVRARPGSGNTEG